MSRLIMRIFMWIGVGLLTFWNLVFIYRRSGSEETKTPGNRLNFKFVEDFYILLNYVSHESLWYGSEMQVLFDRF